MSDLCAGSCSCECGAACVGEQIQDFDRAAGILDQVRKPVPVCRLLRKQSGMFETEWLQVESQRFIMNLPLLREIEKFPLAAAFFTAVIMSVFVLPARIVLRGVPDDLRVRTNERIISPAL